MGTFRMIRRMIAPPPGTVSVAAPTVLPALSCQQPGLQGSGAASTMPEAAGNCPTTSGSR